MPTVFGHGAFRVVVYLNDHGPAHVHVVGPDGSARFSLGERPEEVRLMDVNGIRKKDLRKLVAEILDRHDECLQAWKENHGEQDSD